MELIIFFFSKKYIIIDIAQRKHDFVIVKHDKQLKCFYEHKTEMSHASFRGKAFEF